MVMATKKQLFRGAHDILNNRRLNYEKKWNINTSVS